MKKHNIVILLIFLMIITFPIYCGTIILHEFGHYLTAIALGEKVTGAKLTCSLNENSQVLIKGNVESKLIAFGSTLSLILLIPALQILFRIKNNIIFWFIYLFYAYMVLVAFQLMYGDFDRIGLLWLNRILASVFLLIGLIPLFKRLYKGEIKVLENVLRWN